jgi:hypothetical protein
VSKDMVTNDDDHDDDVISVLVKSATIWVPTATLATF